mmetsp:Transcript_3271/g.5419  ORF Transcript_3271/g.5419 Transcript_3271/m.5419 type:complete len:273 (+) Transcript_3271:4098-4916(+)
MALLQVRECFRDPNTVHVVDEAVVEHAQHFVGPQTDHLQRIHHSSGRFRQTLEHLAHVAEVEGVVALGRRGQKLVPDPVVQLHRGVDHSFGSLLVRLAEVLFQKRRKDGGEDSRNGPIRHLRERQEVEVAEKTVRHRVSASAGRTHRSDKLGIHDGSEMAWRLPLVPTTMIEPLSEQLNRRLRKVLFALRHVEVVHEDDVLLADRRPKHAFSPLVHLGIDDVLGHVGRGPSREGHEDGDNLRRHTGHQLAGDVEGFAGAGFTDAEHVVSTRQ